MEIHRSVNRYVNEWEKESLEKLFLIQRQVKNALWLWIRRVAQVVQIAAFIAYYISRKSAEVLFNVVVYRPRALRQIAPGQYEEVSHVAPEYRIIR